MKNIFTEGTIVEYVNLPFEWRWEICWKAMTEQAVIGSIFIVKDLSWNIPNSEYNFSCMAIPEINIKLAI